MKTCTEILIRNRLASETQKLWEPGQNITIGFLGKQETSLKFKVIDAAEKWLEYCNLTFEWISNPDRAMVRIAFVKPGSWSYIGKDCLTVNRIRPTINFGWLKDENDDMEIERVVLHEVGHMLGFIHEHQSPAAGIPWNKVRVYEFYGMEMGWPKERVDENIFNRYGSSHCRYSEFDSSSIMCYPIPVEFTTNGFKVDWNTGLSATDKEFAATVYPKLSR